MATNSIIYEIDINDKKFIDGLNRISARVTQLNSQLKQGMSQPFQNITPSLNKATDAMDKAQKSAKGLGDTGFWLNSSFGQVTQGLNKYSFASLGATVRVNALIAGFTVLSGMVVKSLNVFMDYEKVLTSIKVLGGLTADEMDKLSKRIDEVASATSFSAEEIAKASLSLAQAGFNGEQVSQSIGGIAFAAQATGNTITDTSDAVITALKSMQFAADQSGRVADVFTAVANATKVKNFGEFSQALKYSGAIANEIGVSFEELASSIGFLSDRSIVGGQAGRHLRIILQSLIAPTAEGKKELEKLGIQLKDSNGKFIGLSNVLTQFSQKTADLGDQKLGIFKNIVGRDAMTSFQMLVQGGNDLSVVLEKVGNSAGIAQAQAKAMTDNLAGDVEKLDEAINSTWRNIGEAFAPLARETVQLFTGIINKALEYKNALISIAKILLDVKKAAIDASADLISTGFNWARTRGASEEARKAWINQAMQLNPSLDVEQAKTKLSQTLNAFAEAGTKREDMDRKIEEDIARMKNELMQKGLVGMVTVKEKETEMTEDYAEKQLELTKKAANDALIAKEDAYRKELEALDNTHKAKLLALETQLTTQAVTQDQYSGSLIRLETERYEAIKNLQTKYGKVTLDTEISIQKKLQDERKLNHDISVREYQETTKQISDDTADAVATIEFEISKISKAMATMPEGMAKATLLNFQLDYTQLEKTKQEIKKQMREITVAFTAISSPTEAETSAFNSQINSFQDRILDLKRKQDLLVLGIPEQVNEILKANRDETKKLNEDINNLITKTREFYDVGTAGAEEIKANEKELLSLRKQETDALNLQKAVEAQISKMESDLVITKVSMTEKEVNAKEATLKGLNQISRSYYEQAEALRYAQEQMKAYRTLLEVKEFSDNIDKMNRSLQDNFAQLQRGLSALGVDSNSATQAFNAVANGFSEISKQVASGKALEKAFNANLISEKDYKEANIKNKAEIADASISIATEATDAWISQLDAQIAKEDELIAKQQERVDSIREGLKAGLTAQEGFNAAVLSQEEERLAKLQAQREEDYQKQRALAILQMALSAGAGVARAFADYPFPYSAIVAGLTIASFLASVAVAQSAAKGAIAETGGRMTDEGFLPAGSKKISGRRHSQGGELVEMEAGEYVFSRSHSQKFAPLFDSIQTGKLKDMQDLSINRSVIEGNTNVFVVDMSRLEARIDKLAEAIRRSDKPSITLDEEGFFASGFERIERNSKLNKRFS